VQAQGRRVIRAVDICKDSSDISSRFQLNERVVRSGGVKGQKSCIFDESDSTHPDEKFVFNDYYDWFCG